jgi:Cys-rich protein (TIGR01571 family)
MIMSKTKSNNSTEMNDLPKETRPVSNLNLRQNDNSFHVLASLLIDMFQSKLVATDDESVKIITLIPEDKEKLHRILPKTAIWDFIDAVNYRLEMTPVVPVSPIHFLTFTCQEICFDKEETMDNPILATYAIKSEAVIVKIYRASSDRSSRGFDDTYDSGSREADYNSARRKSPDKLDEDENDSDGFVHTNGDDVSNSSELSSDESGIKVASSKDIAEEMMADNTPVDDANCIHNNNMTALLSDNDSIPTDYGSIDDFEELKDDLKMRNSHAQGAVNEAVNYISTTEEDLPKDRNLSVEYTNQDRTMDIDNEEKKIPSKSNIYRDVIIDSELDDLYGSDKTKVDRMESSILPAQLDMVGSIGEEGEEIEVLSTFSGTFDDETLVNQDEPQSSSNNALHVQTNEPIRADDICHEPEGKEEIEVLPSSHSTLEAELHATQHVVLLSRNKKAIEPALVVVDIPQEEAIFGEIKDDTIVIPPISIDEVASPVVTKRNDAERTPIKADEYIIRRDRDSQQRPVTLTNEKGKSKSSENVSSDLQHFTNAVGAMSPQTLASNDSVARRMQDAAGAFFDDLRWAIDEKVEAFESALVNAIVSKPEKRQNSRVPSKNRSNSPAKVKSKSRSISPAKEKSFEESKDHLTSPTNSPTKEKLIVESKDHSSSTAKGKSLIESKDHAEPIPKDDSIVASNDHAQSIYVNTDYAVSHNSNIEDIARKKISNNESSVSLRKSSINSQKFNERVTVQPENTPLDMKKEGSNKSYKHEGNRTILQKEDDTYRLNAASPASFSVQSGFGSLFSGLVAGFAPTVKGSEVRTQTRSYITSFPSDEGNTKGTDISLLDFSVYESMEVSDTTNKQQLLLELKEACTLMNQSITPETTRFWSDHIQILKSRLDALGAKHKQVVASQSINYPISIDNREVYGQHQPIVPLIAVDAQSVSGMSDVRSTRGIPVVPALIQPSNNADGQDKNLDRFMDPSPEQYTNDDMGMVHSSKQYEQPEIELSQSQNRYEPNPVEGMYPQPHDPKSLIDDDEGYYEYPLVDVVAPADLPGGYHFEAEIEGQRFLATVPSGGVQQGETFTCYMKELDSVAIDIPVGEWKDGLFNMCELGWCHPVLWNAVFCPLIALGQIQTRVHLDFLGRPKFGDLPYSNRYMMLLVIAFWIGTNVTLFAACNLKWSRGLELSVADGCAFVLVNVAMFGFIVFVTQSTRSSVREKFMIRERCCYDLEDVCCAALCLPCAVGQMQRHTANYEDYEAVCCSKTGLPNGVRVNQEPAKVKETTVENNDGYMV